VPVALSELRDPPVEEVANGAVEFRHAYVWYLRYESDPGNPQSPGLFADEWTDAEWSDAEAYAAACAEFISLLRQGVRKPHFALGVDWERGPDAEVVTIPLAQQAASVLLAQALVASRAGRPQEAAEAIALLLDVADRQEQMSALTYGMRLVQYAIAAGIVEEVAPRVGDGSIRQLVESRLLAIEPESLLAQAIRGERAMGLWILETRKGGWLSRIGTLHDGCKYLDAMGRLEELVSTPFGIGRLQAESVVADAEATPSWCTVTRVAVPRTARWYGVRARTVAAVRLARLGVLVLEHKRSTGMWPESIRGFDKSVAEDPLTGKAFGYTPSPGGVRLFSQDASAEEEGYGTRDLVWDLR
jgi:hypothetical protein